MSTVVISGASRGIGLELARAYAADGWRVHACCRNPAGAEELARALEGRDAQMHPLDVTEASAIGALAAALAPEPIDLLINNAGIFGGEQDFGSADYASWEQVWRTNVIAPYRVAEAFVPHVAASGLRCMAFVSSISGSIASVDAGGGYIYQSSKTGLNMVVVNLARDLAGRGITVLALHPGWVRTDMGGAQAPVSPEESIAGMRRVIAESGPERSGTLWDYRGERLPW